MRKSKGCKWDFGYIKGHWRIDALTAAELETAVDNCEVDPKALVFDWKHIFFCRPACSFKSSEKYGAERKMQILDVNEVVRGVFCNYRFFRYFTIK